MNVKDIKPYWVLVAGFVVLLMFVIIVKMPSGPGSGSRHPRPWHPRPWHHLLGPGGIRHWTEGFSGQADPTFTMFGVDWCGHCKSAKPKFEAMGSKVTIGDHAVYLRYINPEKDKAAAAGYALDGYPTFYLDHGSKRIKYDGPRNADGFREFLQQQLSS